MHSYRQTDAIKCILTMPRPPLALVINVKCNPCSPDCMCNVTCHCKSSSLVSKWATDFHPQADDMAPHVPSGMSHNYETATALYIHITETTLLYRINPIQKLANKCRKDVHAR